MLGYDLCFQFVRSIIDNVNDVSRIEYLMIYCLINIKFIWFKVLLRMVNRVHQSKVNVHYEKSKGREETDLWFVEAFAWSGIWKLQ